MPIHLCLGIKPTKYGIVPGWHNAILSGDDISKGWETVTKIMREGGLMLYTALY